MNPIRKQWMAASLAIGLALFSAPVSAQPVLEAPEQGSVPFHEGVRFIPTLYGQTDSATGAGIASQNFEPTYDAYDAQGADDFVVPVGEVWGVTQIYVPGYFAGSGPAASVDVFVYRNRADSPGEEIYHAAAIVPGESDGDLSIALPSPPLLFAGTYWLSVRVNMDLDTGGQWLWSTRIVQSGNARRWRNPGDGYGTGCTTWTAGCPAGGPDMLFALLGYASSGFACNNPPEGFSVVPPADWSIASMNAVTWSTVAGSGVGGNFTGGSGGAASASSVGAIPLGFDTQLKSKSFSLLGAHSASVRYLANYQHSAFDTFALDISTNFGSNWTNLLMWSEGHGGSFALPGEAVEVDLDAYRDDPFLILRWRYQDGAMAADIYAQIDDVRLDCFPFSDGFESGNTARWSRTTP